VELNCKRDFQLLTPAVWKFLFSIYEGGPAIQIAFIKKEASGPLCRFKISREPLPYRTEFLRIREMSFEKRIVSEYDAYLRLVNELPEGNNETLYVIGADFVNKWFRFVRSPSSRLQPGSIDNSYLAQKLINENNKDNLENKKDFFLL